MEPFSIPLEIGDHTVNIDINDPQDLIDLRQDLLDAERRVTNLIEEYEV